MTEMTQEFFQSFGEIYFSNILFNSIKVWRLHKEITLNHAYILGKVKLVLYDDRNDSKAKGKYHELILSPDKYYLIAIPKIFEMVLKGLKKDNQL